MALKPPPRNLLEFNNFPKGLVTRTPAERISVEAIADGSQNIALDDKLMATKSFGHFKYNSTTLGAATIRGACVFSSLNSGSGVTTKYYVVACNKFLWYSVAGSGTFAKYQISGVDLTFASETDVEFAQYNNKLYVVNGLYPVISVAAHTTDRMLKIDGTTVTGLTVSDIPKAMQYLWVEQERLFGSGSTDALNGLFWTNAFFDYSTNAETNWTPTSGLNYNYTGKDDGEVISAIRGYGGYMYIWKPRNVYRLTMSGDITTWSIVKVDTLYGCAFQRTIQELEGYLYYLSPSGVIKFDGNNANLIDDAVRDKILALPQLGSGLKSILYSTTTDFGSNTGTEDTSGNQIKPLTLTPVVLNDLALNNATISSTFLASEILSGTVANLVDGDDTTYFHCTLPVGGAYINIDFGTSAERIMKLKAISDNNVLGIQLRMQYSTDNVAWTTEEDAPDIDYVTRSLVWYYAKQTFRYARILLRYSNSGQIGSLKLYSLNSYLEYSAVSDVIDIGHVPVQMGYFSCNSGVYSKIQFQTSSDNNTWGSFSTDKSSGASLSGSLHRYLRYKRKVVANLDSPVIYTTSVDINNMTSVCFGTSWQSGVIDLLETPSSFGFLISKYTQNSQIIQFYIRSAATSGGVSSATYIAQYNGNLITVTPYRYIQVLIAIQTTNISQLPYIENFYINYYGTVLIKPCAYSTKNEYGLNVADAGQTINNIVYKYNKQGYWLLRTNKHNNVYFVDEQLLLSGTSDADGFVRINESGNVDDTTVITTILITKNMSMERFVNYFRKYVVEWISDQSWTFSYRINSGTWIDITIESASVMTRILRSLPGVTMGNYIQLKATSAATDASWKLGSIGVEEVQGRELRSES